MLFFCHVFPSTGGVEYRALCKNRNRHRGREELPALLVLVLLPAQSMKVLLGFDPDAEL